MAPPKLTFTPMLSRLRASWRADPFAWIAALLCPFAIVVPHLLIKSGHHPPVGTYIAILGVLAAAVTFRKDTSLPEKALWTILFALLGFAEIRNLYISEQEQIEEFRTIADGLSQANGDLEQTKKGLDKTAGGLDTASENLQTLSDRMTDSSTNARKQFKASMTASNEILRKTGEAADMAAEGVANMTGGDSYLIVAPIFIPIKQPNTFELVTTLGKNCKRRTLEDVSILVRKLPIPGEGTVSGYVDQMTSRTRAEAEFHGTVPSTEMLPIGQITPDMIGETTYFVNTTYRNKETIETLIVRRADSGKWEMSFTVGQVTNGTPLHPDSIVKPLEVTVPKWRSQDNNLKQ